MLLVQSAQLMLSSRLAENEQIGWRGVLSDVGFSWLAELLPASANDGGQPFSPERFLYPYAISFQTGGSSYAAFAKGDSLITFCRDLVRGLFPVMVVSKQNDSPVPFGEAIRQDGILVDFGRPLSVGVVSGVLGGADTTGGDFFRYCFFAKDLSGFHMYIKDEVSGKTLIYSSADQRYIQSLDSLLQNVPVFTSLVAVYLTDAGVVSGLKVPAGQLYPDNRSLLLPSLWFGNSIYSQNYNTAILSNLFSSFGSSFGSPRRRDRKDGSVDFIENDYTITITPEGRFHYVSTKVSAGIPIDPYVSARQDFSFTLTDALTAAQVFIDSLNKSAVGGQDAELRFKSCRYDSTDNSLEIDFDYCADGLPIVISGKSYGARLKYNGGYFVDIDINCREYSKSAQVYPIPDLPLSLSFAALNGLRSVNRIEVGYYDVGEGSINPDYILFGSTR